MHKKPRITDFGATNMFIVHWMQPQIYFKCIACMIKLTFQKIKKTYMSKNSLILSLWGNIKPQAKCILVSSSVQLKWNHEGSVIILIFLQPLHLRFI